MNARLELVGRGLQLPQIFRFALLGIMGQNTMRNRPVFTTKNLSFDDHNCDDSTKQVRTAFVRQLSTPIVGPLEKQSHIRIEARKLLHLLRINRAPHQVLFPDCNSPPYCTSSSSLLHYRYAIHRSSPLPVCWWSGPAAKTRFDRTHGQGR